MQVNLLVLDRPPQPFDEELSSARPRPSILMAIPRYTIERGSDLFIINLPYAIERVIALPGDRFTRENGRFLRNGKPVPPEYQPLRPDGVRDHMDFTVPPGRYLVLISYPVYENMFGLMKVTAPFPREGISPDWGDACLVKRNEIIGRCVFIIHPVRHRRWLTPPKSK